MSSHREAPEIAKDPVADNTDTYAFMHPTQDNQVVIVANFIPLQQPNGGPNFYEFSDDVLYEINISNTNKSEANIKYQFRFTTEIRNPNTFLYNIGPIASLGDTNWNRPQYYSIARIENGRGINISNKVPVPPVNVGVRSTPNYTDLADAAVTQIGGRKFFAGQRSDVFNVDLGSIFDLGALRPFNQAHLISQPEMNGVNATQSYNVHSIVMQVPASDLTRNHQDPSASPLDRRNVVGIWASASRRKARVFNAKTGKYGGRGPAVQVSRLGNPLFNEVIVPMAEKDKWNSVPPSADAPFEKYVNKPELAGLLPVLYPGVFPNLKAYTKPRADLNAILLTGIPAGVVPGFQNFTGAAGVKADMLRLNMAVPPSANENPLGLVAGDAAGFPNGRRLRDDVVSIELRAVAGLTIPLVDPDYTPDDAASALTDGTSYTGPDILDDFPFMPPPGGGYQTVPGTTSVN